MRGRHVYVCLSARVCVCVCVCVRDREREGGGREGGNEQLESSVT